jgi:hypothetical protein
MDMFDERILAVLNDGKPIVFTQLLSEVGFSHDTLKRILQASQKSCEAQNCPQTKKIRIKTILHQFRSRHARAFVFHHLRIWDLV